MDNSPLGKLSPELRNSIWELVLYDGEVEIKPFISRVLNGGRLSLSLALIATCQQIHREAMPMFYSLNKFTVGNTWVEGEKAMAWLSHFCTTIGPANVRSLRSVKINFGDRRHLWTASEYNPWTASEYRRNTKTQLQQGIVGDSYHPDCAISAECTIQTPQIDHRPWNSEREDTCFMELIPFGVNLRDVEGDWKSLRHTVADLKERLELVMEDLQD